MKVYKSISELPDFKQSVLTIGSFDGLHLGHQKIIQRVSMKARENNLESVVVTFTPHPRTVLFPGDKDFRLLSVGNEKIALFEKSGIDHLVCFPFTFEFSQLSAIEYIENFIVKYFNPAYIIIGYDHRFGLNRTGDIFLLRQVADKYRFKIIEIEKQEIEEIAISSTKIRNSLASGDIETARIYSNHNYLLTGEVVNGYKYGRKLGFPTANLRLPKEKLLPGDGVYAVYVLLEGEQYEGMMYIGNKPSFDDHNHKVIEVHIFDFNFDIYGSEMTIELIERIRGSMKFDSFEDLQAQLMIDRQETLEILGLHPTVEPELPRINLIILNYNGKDYLEEYLPSVISNNSLPLKYIVADNGSDDDSIEFLKYYFPEVEIHEMENNYGFAEGYNRVIRSVNETEYIVFLNSDVEITEDWLSPIIEAMDADKRIGIAQPKILSIEENENFEYAGAAGGYLDTLAYPFCRGRLFDSLEMDEGQYDDDTEVFWTSGAAMVMRKKLFDNLGGFDSDFFAHQEEIDLCWRAKRAGYKVMAIGKSKVYHLGGGTLSYVNPHKHFLNFRNNLMMLLKNETGFNVFWKFPFRLMLDGIAGIKFLFDGRPGSTLAIIKAHLNLYRSLGKIWKKRNEVKKVVKEHAVGTERISGRYEGMIIWDYYVRKRTKFSDIIKNGKKS